MFKNSYIKDRYQTSGIYPAAKRSKPAFGFNEAQRKKIVKTQKAIKEFKQFTRSIKAPTKQYVDVLRAIKTSPEVIQNLGLPEYGKPNRSLNAANLKIFAGRYRAGLEDAKQQRFDARNERRRARGQPIVERKKRVASAAFLANRFLSKAARDALGLEKGVRYKDLTEQQRNQLG